MTTRAKTTRSSPTRRRAPGTASKQPPGVIPHWQQLKLEIVRKYATAYSTILSRQPGLAHYWIDGFAGAGVHVAKRTGEFVPGSPLNALLVTPPFRHHYLVDLDGHRVEALRRVVGDGDDVTLLRGDGNLALLEEVLPRVRHEDYRRALCVLDPSPLHLDWRVVELAGRLRTIDLFVGVPVAGAADDAPRALARRLREDAGFANVVEPLPLRDEGSRVAAHLCFASRNPIANKVVEDIFARHRAGAPRAR